MNMLFTRQEYMSIRDIDEFQLNTLISDEKLFEIKKSTITYVVENRPELTDNNEIKNILSKSKKKELLEAVKSLAIEIKTNGRSQKTETRIQLIKQEAEKLNKIGIKVSGFSQRNIQIMIRKILDANSSLQRKTRDDKFQRRTISNETFKKALDLISQLYLDDPLHSLNQAIDQAIHLSKLNERLYDVAACNFFTLRRQINTDFKQSGMKTVHQYMNHYNQFRKKLPYVPGAFRELAFGSVWSLDDHKMDVAGVKVFNQSTGEWEQKQIWMWGIFEMRTMKILDWEFKAGSEFTSEDIIRLMMRCIKKYGVPSNKIICDQGLASSDRVKEFCNRLQVVLEPQPAYSPTSKANNERPHLMFKKESDIYCNNFTGSNHPVEGRHTTEKLSPEATEELMSDAIKRYDNYFSDYYIRRPRTRDIEGIEHLLDNTKRVSIETLYNFYYKDFKPYYKTGVELRYAYMKYDNLKRFDKFYFSFKKKIYLPNEDISVVIHDSDYKYIVAYDPDDLNNIDIYTGQDILDRITGDFIESGTRVCTLYCVDNLEMGERARRIADAKKKEKKKILELARAHRSRVAIEKNLINETVNKDGEITNLRKEQEKQIAGIIKYAIPMDKIDVAWDEKMWEQSLDALEDNKEISVQSLDSIQIDE